MFLFLAHHGDALPASVDPMRPLSEAGREAVTRLAGLAAGLGARPQQIWHSGKLRARETAEIYWRACNPLASVMAVRHLQPNDDPALVRGDLAGESADLMLVGHYPHLPGLLALLLGDPAGTSFPQHGIVALEGAATEGWEERWRLTT